MHLICCGSSIPKASNMKHQKHLFCLFLSDQCTLEQPLEFTFLSFVPMLLITLWTHLLSPSVSFGKVLLIWEKRKTGRLKQKQIDHTEKKKRRWEVEVRKGGLLLKKKKINHIVQVNVRQRDASKVRPASFGTHETSSRSTPFLYLQSIHCVCYRQAWYLGYSLLVSFFPPLSFPFPTNYIDNRYWYSTHIQICLQLQLYKHIFKSISTALNALQCITGMYRP